ncbi:MaoC family dehydratase N-terminal domain-containing protein [Aliisedimentitalea scapharcae]|uniref:MaoC family dehydratase N-terminal domain-containing protein n=1 Tax=Aliisedimentitalea scapharcae TaxID=1524259 RepID=A0ABZ2XVY8_9RHOB
MIDRTFIGQSFAPLSVEVEKGRLRAFARATGQTDPIYTDVQAAKSAGYRSLPAPPTFLFSLDLEREDPFYFINLMKIDLGRVLHGEQHFTYGEPICAGDTITLTSTVQDIFDKKGGAMEFVILNTTATNQFDEDVGGMTRTIVVRHPT